MKNNLSHKGFIVPVLLGVIAILVIAGGVYIYKDKKVDAPVVVNENEKVEVKDENLNKIEKNSQKETSVLSSKIVKSSMFGPIEFSHPETLVEKSYNEQFGIPVISLSHSFSYKHINSCDMKDGLSIDTATDFSAQFKLYNMSLIESIKKDNQNNYKDFFDGSIIKVQPGFVDKYKLGSVDGYKTSIGTEGCGYSTYYFPVSAKETLVIRRDYYLQTLQMGREKLINIPGFISQAKEEQIFKDILTSIKGLENKETMSIKLYFGNRIYNPEMLDCSLVYPVTRIIPKTQAVAEASLNELIKGPTVEEIKLGYSNVLPIETKVNYIKIVDGVLSVDFNKYIEYGFTSCSGAARMSSIISTLKQFPTVKDIKFSVAGNSNRDEILQP